MYAIRSYYDLARQGAAGGNGNRNATALRYRGQVADVAAAAADAAGDVAGDLQVAVEQLDAVRQQDQRLFGRHPQLACPHQLVVEGDERLLQGVAVDAEQPPRTDDGREEVADDDSYNFV